MRPAVLFLAGLAVAFTVVVFLAVGWGPVAVGLVAVSAGWGLHRAERASLRRAGTSERRSLWERIGMGGSVRWK